MARDRRNEVDLEVMGWTVMRFWRSDACAEEVRAWLAAAGRERGKHDVEPDCS